MSKLKTVIGFTGAIISTTLCFLSPVLAQDKPGSNREYLEKVVFLNENGLVSVDYIDVYFYEMAEYATQVVRALYINLDGAKKELETLNDSLVKNPAMVLDPETAQRLMSLQSNGQTDVPLLISSLLRKYTDKNPVDIETDSDHGQYNTVRGSQCSRFGLEDVGVVQHLVVLEKDRHEAIADAICERVTATASMLERVLIVDNVNRIRLEDKAPVEIGLARDSVIDAITPVAPTAPAE